MLEINRKDPSLLAADRMHAAHLVRIISKQYPWARHGHIHAALSDVVADLGKKLPRLGFTMAKGKALINVDNWLVDGWVDLLVAGVGARVDQDPSAGTYLPSVATANAARYNTLFNRLLFEEYNIH